MIMTSKEAARLIDISAVRSQHTLKDLEELVSLARKYHFINLHVLPCWISTLADRIRDLDDVYVGSPAGFPGGGHTTETKMCEARQMIEDGVDELDMVMNIGKFKNREYNYVSDEIQAIVELARGKIRATKVIVEINVLTDDEMLMACELVKKSGADFIKTGTGWVPGTANIPRIKKMKEVCGNDIKIKAAGGIRTCADALAMLRAGATRLGTSAGRAIVEGLNS